MENILGRVPLILCFLRGNKNNTILHFLRYDVPDGAAADSRHDSGTESLLYEVNVWMWNYGRVFPRKISVAYAEEMRQKRVQDSRRREAEPLKRRGEAAAVRPVESISGVVRKDISHMTSYTTSYTMSYIAYRIRHRVYVRYRIRYRILVRHRIRHRSCSSSCLKGCKSAGPYLLNLVLLRLAFQCFHMCLKIFAALF